MNGLSPSHLGTPRESARGSLKSQRAATSKLVAEAHHEVIIAAVATLQIDDSSEGACMCALAGYIARDGAPEVRSLGRPLGARDGDRADRSRARVSGISHLAARLTR